MTAWRFPADRRQRTRLAYAATTAATRWAAASGIDLMSLGRNPVVAATLDAGIRSEALARACRPGAARQARAPINVHEGGAGPAVVLINGWTASGLVWPHRLVAALEREHRVVRIDNRGTGWSRHAPRPYTISDLAGDARRVIDELGLHRPTLVGISMGGMIAQELAMSWPDRVGRRANDAASSSMRSGCSATKPGPVTVAQPSRR